MNTKYTNKIEFNGQTYMGDGEAFATGRIFPGCFNDVENGEEYTNEWAEDAIDKDGNNVQIIYHFEDVKGEEPEPDTYDWESNIVNVKIIG